MDVFNRRISQDEAARMLAAGAEQGLLQDARALVFHHLPLMRQRIAAVTNAFPEGALHTVAIKANPLVEVLREVVEAGAGLEAASFEEVHLAMAAGCAPERIVFDSPAKTRHEIAEALLAGVYINADTFEELERIDALRDENAREVQVGLRINPQVGQGTIAHTSVAMADSKFGIPLQDQRQQIFDALRAFPWVGGLHVHVGSQGCTIEQLAEAARRVAELRDDLNATGARITKVDIGGGLPTVYRHDQVAPTPAAYAGLLRERVPGLFADDCQLITEFGRAIQANCGVALSRVEYVKPAQAMAVVHLGADFLLRPVYRPEDWSHECFVLDREGRPKQGPLKATTLVGPLCFAGDIIGRALELPELEAGDWLAIRDVGAYTLGMWSRHCSRGMPAVLGYDPAASSPLRVLREQESPEDVVRFWS